MVSEDFYPLVSPLVMFFATLPERHNLLSAVYPLLSHHILDKQSTI